PLEAGAGAAVPCGPCSKQQEGIYGVPRATGRDRLPTGKGKIPNPRTSSLPLRLAQYAPLGKISLCGRRGVPLYRLPVFPIAKLRPAIPGVTSMNTLVQAFQAPPANLIKTSVHKDLVVVGAVTVLTFALSSLFELNEWIAALTVPHERYQIDELPLTILAMAMALAWFSWRRSRQAVEQVTLRLAAQQALMDSEEQYRMLFMENLSGNLLATTTGQIKLANPTAARLLGFATPEGLNGRRL